MKYLHNPIPSLKKIQQDIKDMRPNKFFLWTSLFVNVVSVGALIVTVVYSGQQIHVLTSQIVTLHFEKEIESIQKELEQIEITSTIPEEGNKRYDGINYPVLIVKLLRAINANPEFTKDMKFIQQHKEMPSGTIYDKLHNNPSYNKMLNQLDDLGSQELVKSAYDYLIVLINRINDSNINQIEKDFLFRKINRDCLREYNFLFTIDGALERGEKYFSPMMPFRFNPAGFALLEETTFKEYWYKFREAITPNIRQR